MPFYTQGWIAYLSVAQEDSAFYNLHPLVIPSHAPIVFFNNQQRIIERNIHLPENAFQTGSAGGQASFFQEFLEIRPGRIFYNAKGS